jgi:uncharacterized membrane protein YgcG
MTGRLQRLAVTLTLTLLLCGGGTATAAEVIHRFDSTVQLAKDGTLTVIETLSIRAEGRQIKHGIFRDFPMLFRDAGGRVREVDFHLLGVSRDGKPEPYFVQRNPRFLRIYAGDKNEVVAPGDHVYVFRYSTGRQVRWFDGKPELNWNVTGNFWDFPIADATYRLELVDGARPLRFTAFTGRLGAHGRDWRGGIDGNGVLAVETTRTLAPGEGLTVVAALPNSAVDPISPQQALWYELNDNRHWILSGIGFAAVAIYYLLTWRAVGRDPPRGIVIPLFHPPAGVSPALANYIDNWGFGRDKWRAFTAAALSLAVRGLISFDQGDDKLILKPKNGTAKAGALPVGERAVFDWVKAQGLSAVIDKAHGAAVAAVGTKFTSGIEAESKNKFFRRNLGYAIAGLAMTVAVVVGVLVIGGLQDEDISVLVVTLFGGFFLGVVATPVAMAFLGRERSPVAVRLVMSLAVVIILASISINLVGTLSPDRIAAALPSAESFILAYPFSFVLVAAFAALNGLFFYLLRAPTVLGRPVMDQLAGLRLYLTTAEADRMNMQAPEITAAHFEALLPYAVALHVEKPWSDAFAAALARAHPGDADPMRYYQPAWTGNSGSWSGAGFGSAVAATVGGMSSALASAVPVSSGTSGFSSGGGGGGSGGGGGGGGGGGW